MAISKQRLQELGQQVIPAGQRLETDRSIQAKRVHSPNKPAQVAEWRKTPNKSDLKGFDTKDAKEPTRSQILKKSGVSYVASEAGRFLRDGQETKRLIDQVSDKIFDRDSMEREIKKIWNTDKSLKHLVNNTVKDDWDTLFNQSKIQDIIRNTTFAPAVKEIQKQFGVGAIKAKEVFDRMTQKAKDKLLDNIINGKRVKLGKQKRLPTTRKIIPQLPQIRQRSRQGNIYTRSKPQRWTRQQETFLRNYKGEKIKDIVTIYNNSFSVKRTKPSISTKIFRLKPKTK